MLSSFNRFSQTIVSKILLGLLILSFGIFWGIGNIFQKGNPLETVATVGNKKVKIQDLQRAFSQHLASLKEQGVPNLTKQEVKQELRRVLFKLIDDTLLDIMAEELDLVIGDTQIQSFVRSQKPFQFNGHFSRKRFEFYLKQSHQTEEQFLDMVRKTLLRKQLLDVFAFLKPPQFMKKTVQDVLFQKRKGAYLYVGPQSDHTLSTPSEALLKSFYNKHKETFRIPEKRKIQFFTLPVSFFHHAEKTEEKLGLQERIYQERMTIEDGISAGESLQQMASKKGHALSDIGLVSASEALQKTFKGIDEKQKAFIIKDIFSSHKVPGIYVLRLEDGTLFVYDIKHISPSHIPDFPTVQDKVKTRYEQEERDKNAGTKAKAILQKIQKDASFLQTARFKPFNLVFSKEKDTDVPGEVKTLAYSLAEGQAAVTQAVQGGRYVVYVQAIQNIDTTQLSSKQQEAQDKQITYALHENVERALLNSLYAFKRITVNEQSLNLFDQVRM